MNLKKIKPIKCPHCGYDGSDLKIGMQPIEMSPYGIYPPRILCSKCGRYFNIEFEEIEK